MAFQSFENLEVWRRACRLAVRVFELLRESREFSLRDQMQRSAVSVASNIAEGAERTKRDFLRFLTIARGSSSELRTQSFIASRIGMLNETDATYLVEETREINRMLIGLSKAVQNHIDSEH